MKVVGLVLALVLLAAMPTTARADSNTVLQGRVYQENGQPAPHVRIDAVSPSGWYRTTTGADGRFVLFGLENDVYTVNAYSDIYGRGGVIGTVVAPGETEYVVMPLSRFDCPAWGYSVRSGNSYLVNAHHDNHNTFKCL